MAKKVSVILVNYNGMSHLDTCISSVLNQSYPNFEVIFVDNNSGDGSLEYARSKFPNLIFIVTDKNLGYAGGINRGLEHASGDYIAPLNIDTEVDKLWLAPMVKLLDENPGAGAVTPKILLYNDRTRVNAAGLNIHITGLGFARGLNDTSRKLPDGPMRVAGVSGCSYLVRKDLLKQTQGLNEDNFMYYDDVDLSWTLNLMGYEIYCVPESVVYHDYQLQMSPEKLFFLEYGRLNMLLYGLRLPTFVICLPALAFTELLVAGYCIIKGRRYVSAKLKVLTSVFKGIKQLMKKRRDIQRLRRISDFQLFRRFQLSYDWSQLFRILR